MHYDHRNIGHNSPQFFPWHRAFLREFEKELQNVNPTVMLPYWDWSGDSQAPELSRVFSADMFGGNGRDDDSCVVDGQFANWQIIYPTRRCLSRSFDQGNQMSAFSSPEVIKALQNSATNYDRFRQLLEVKPHAQIHNAIGGDFQTMYTANDPLFWLHHGFIDKIWADWQKIRKSNARSYGGQDANGVSARTQDSITPFNYRVSEVLDTRELCYEYGQSFLSRHNEERTKAIANLPLPSTPRNVAVCVGLEILGQQNISTMALPESSDRSELVALRDTAPIPDEYIAMNHFKKRPF
ncbi:hypothetical protein BDF19DRAFT_462774 [Syncephalis fuscata]|nr:hypothetical protein BDF19DRAFT_462774 [Syncephalis fuscata]